MGLSTHVLDTMHGTPAAGMAVELYTTQGGQATLVRRFQLNADGRNPDGPLYRSDELKPGTYLANVVADSKTSRIVFTVAAPDAKPKVDFSKVLGFLKKKAGGE